MTCYEPIKLFWVGDHYVFAHRDEQYVIHNHMKYKNSILVPCGKCVGCRIDRSREWANRMAMELKYHEKACFITLTYNDEHLPYSDVADDNGEFHPTLVKKDLQKFLKRLRKFAEPEKIRFFACGEYGDRKLRPHYHLIIFGFDFSDKEIWKVEDGYITYRSNDLEKLWKFGFSTVCEVNWNTCSYVARYCVKKIGDKPNIYYQSLGISNEFNTMSRRPGIGRRYYEENKELIYENQEIILSNSKGAVVTKPPRYFDRLYEKDNPIAYMKMKMKRREEAKSRMETLMRKDRRKLSEILYAQRDSYLSRFGLKRGEL